MHTHTSSGPPSLAAVPKPQLQPPPRASQPAGPASGGRPRGAAQPSRRSRRLRHLRSATGEPRLLVPVPAVWEKRPVVMSQGERELHMLSRSLARAAHRHATGSAVSLQLLELTCRRAQCQSRGGQQTRSPAAGPCPAAEQEARSRRVKPRCQQGNSHRPPRTALLPLRAKPKLSCPARMRCAAFSRSAVPSPACAARPAWRRNPPAWGSCPQTPQSPPPPALTATAGRRQPRQPQHRTPRLPCSAAQPTLFSTLHPLHSTHITTD